MCETLHNCWGTLFNASLDVLVPHSLLNVEKRLHLLPVIQVSNPRFSTDIMA